MITTSTSILSQAHLTSDNQEGGLLQTIATLYLKDTS